jgi:peptide-methionine (S)-S-oxide reductase
VNRIGRRRRRTTQNHAELDKDKTFNGPITTKVVPLKHFYPAKDYHQDYFEKHPKNPYIVCNDWPKVSKLQEEYPSLYNQYDP